MDEQWFSARLRLREMLHRRVEATHSHPKDVILARKRAGWSMRISRETDGLKFVGECTPQNGFLACDIECAHCGRRIDPHAVGDDISLKCTGCDITAKVFWSEADLRVYL